MKEKSEIETPKVEEAPLAPKPEVVVEKQKPVEEVEDKKEEEDPRPEQKAVPQASAASPETQRPAAGRGPTRREAGGAQGRPLIPSRPTRR